VRKISNLKAEMLKNIQS